MYLLHFLYCKIYDFFHRKTFIVHGNTYDELMERAIFGIFIERYRLEDRSDETLKKIYDLSLKYLNQSAPPDFIYEYDNCEELEEIFYRNKKETLIKIIEWEKHDAR